MGITWKEVDEDSTEQILVEVEYTNPEGQRIIEVKEVGGSWLCTAKEQMDKGEAPNLHRLEPLQVLTKWGDPIPGLVQVRPTGVVKARKPRVKKPKPVVLQIPVRQELAARIREMADLRDMPVAVLVRDLLLDYTNQKTQEAAKLKKSANILEPDVTKGSQSPGLAQAQAVWKGDGKKAKQPAPPLASSTDAREQSAGGVQANLDAFYKAQAEKRRAAALAEEANK